jgi:pimeloyl-ACP methyl ester carboxylesterase
MKRHVAILSLLVTYGSGVFAPVQAQNTLDQARAVIQDLEKIVSPNGIQESYKVQIGGIPQWVYVRGQDQENPIILFVHGGPASPIVPTSWQFQRPIEEYFTVVNWDQRGAGKTYLETSPELVAPTLHVDQYVSDIIELSEYLRERYHKQKLILMAHSWGTIIGLEAASLRPDLFHAYVGIGQVINGHENERISFEYGLARAKADSNSEALREMAAISPYPGAEPITRDRVIIARKWPQYYGGLTAFRSNSKYYFQGGRLSPEYTDDDLTAIDRGSILTVDRVMHTVLGADLDQISRLSIPVLIFLGRHDYTTPTEPVVRWMSRLQAPYKRSIWFEHSAHMIPWEEPGKTLISLVEYARPLATQSP